MSHHPALGPPPSNMYRPEVRNHVLAAVLVAILCCSPLSLVGILYGMQVQPALHRGDYDLAQKMSAKAKAAIIWGFVVMYILGGASMAITWLIRMSVG